MHSVPLAQHGSAGAGQGKQSTSPTFNLAGQHEALNLHKVFPQVQPDWVAQGNKDDTTTTSSRSGKSIPFHVTKVGG